MTQIRQTIKQKLNTLLNHVNKDYLPLVLVMILALAIMIFGYLYFTFTPHLILNEDGFAVQDKQMTANLLNGISGQSKQLTTKALPLKASDTLYQNQQRLYLGESHKKGLEKDYPLFLNQGLALFNISSKNDLIDAAFNRYAGYENFIVSDGSIYHYLEKEKADNRTYYFLKMPNQLYLNLRPMKITTSLHSYEIRMNSIVYFSENLIRYYTLDQGVFQYHEVLDCDLDTTVMLADTKYDYETILGKLELLAAADAKQPIAVAPTASPKPTVSPTPSPSSKPEVSYEKPTVRLSNVKAGIYSVAFQIEIHDPSGVIESDPTLEVRTSDKLHLRKMIQNSGTGEMTGLLPDTAFGLHGYFTYYDQHGTLVKETLSPITFHTKKISDLKPIKMRIKNGAIYSKKIELSEVAIVTDLNDEAVKGIVKGEITIDGESYSISKKQLVALLNGEQITYQSPERIVSNKKVDYAFHFYDSMGSELQVEDGKGTTKTAKAEPRVDIINQKTDISKVTLRLKEQNPDQVMIQNYHYVVRTRAGVELSRGNITGTTLEIKNLNSENLYVIEVIGNYDVEDGRGIQKDQVLGTLEFISKPLGSLGYLQLTTKVDQVTDQSAKLHITINDKKSDNRYLELLGAIQVDIVRSDNGAVVYQKRLQGDIADQLKRLKQVTLDLSHLDPYTSYDIVMEAIIYQGQKEYHNQTTLSQKQFMTKKREAKVLVKNLFITGNMYDYDVRIEDPEGAILNDRITVEIRDHQGTLIETTKIKSNDEYERISKDKLIANQTYTITYLASSYNSGVDNSSYQKNYILYEQKIFTKPTIQAGLALNYVREISTGKNVLNGLEQAYSENDENLSCERKVSSISCKRVATTTGATRIYLASDVKLKPNTKYVLSFRYQASDQVPNATNTVWFSNNLGGVVAPSPTVVAGTKNRFYYTFQTTADTSAGYRIFLNTANMAPGDQVTYADLMLEEGTEPSKFEAYKMDQNAYDASFTYQITNALDTLPTEQYYVRMYENDQLLEEYQYDITDTSGVSDQRYYQLKRNQKYTFELLLKIRDRYYTFGSYSFDTKETLTAIHNEQEFTYIMPYRKYVVVADLDLTGKSHRYLANEIDFLGHTVFRRSSSGGHIWNRILKDGAIKNLNLELAFADKAMNSIRGIAYNNRGLIENVIVSLVESYPTRNTSISLLCDFNSGTIDRFVIQLKSPLYGINYITAGIAENQGIVKNGYVYGDIYNLSDETDPYNDMTSGVVTRTRANGVVEHVYSLANIKMTREHSGSYIGLVLSTVHTPNIRNIYSAGAIEPGNLITTGPAVSSTMYRTKNVYYAADRIYNNTKNTKISYLSLKDKTFQNKVLNGDDAFEVDHLIESGYYPHVKMSDVMPDQALIPLPKVTDEDLVDVISNEVIRQTGDTAVIEVKVNNPSHEKITNLSVQSLTSKIVKQEDWEGKSTLTVELSNPTKYRSSYSVLSITSVGPYGISYTRDYQEKERLLHVDLYKPISTVAEWKEIRNDLAGNYQLQNDLDFKNAIDYVILDNFSGILDGNGHTIKNIDLGTSTASLYMFRKVSGTIQNLTVDHLTAISEKGSYTSASFIYDLVNDSVVDHVHIKNSSLKGGTVAGIAKAATNTIIRNSSVSNVKLEVESTRSVANNYAGGLVANIGSYGTIENCFVSNITIDATKAKIPHGFGAMIGYIGPQTVLTNVYATGRIDANSPYVGGMIGKASEANHLTNGYSMVAINGSQGYTGGIIGDARGVTLKNVISLGNIYSKNASISPGRVVGEVATSTTINNIYGYKDQLINGYVSDETTDEILLSREQVMDAKVLTDQVKLGDAFAYDELEKGYLPKLYDTNDKTLLNNQPNLTLTNEELAVKQVEIDKKTDQATLYLLIDNPDNYPITEVSFDYLTIKKINKNHTSNGRTIMELVVVPERAYDSYQLTSLTYHHGEATKQVTKQTRIDIQFYKDLENYSDWQAIPKDTMENYRLVSDIDFKDRVNVNTNVSLGRLESVNGKHKLKNFTSKNKVNEFLIESISLSLKNIIFENIEISNSSTMVGAMIQTFSGEMDGVLFQNINIDTPRASYSGSIGYVIDGIKMDHITLRDVTINGGTYTGGLFAYGTGYLFNLDAQNIHTIGNGYNMNPSTNAMVGGIIGYLMDKGGNHSNIHLREIDVYNRTEQAGNTSAFVGYYVNHYQPSVYSNFNLMDSKIEAVVKNNGSLGGFSGHASLYSTSSLKIANSEIATVRLSNGKATGAVGGQGTYITLTDSTVHDITIDNQNQASVVGGAFGSNGTLTNSTVHNVDIVSLGASTGIVFGNLGSFSGSLVENSRVQGVNNVGGVEGTRCVIYESAVKHNTIIGQDNVGGVCGDSKYLNVVTSFSDQNQIYGRNNVGNVAGRLTGNEGYALIKTYHRNQVVASGVNVGGFFGEVDGTKYDGAIREAHYNMIVDSDLTGQDYIGGLLGNHVGNNLTVTFKNTVVLADITQQLSGASHVSLGVGSAPFQNTTLGNFLVYAGSTINGNKVDADQNYLTPQNIVTAQQLHEAATYRNLNFSTSYWDYTPLQTGHHLQLYINSGGPQLVRDQDLIPLPTATNLQQRAVFARRAGLSHVLPTVDIYASDVDKVNLEFSTIDPYTTYRYEIGGKVSDAYSLTDRTVTLRYDFHTKVKIIVSDGLNTKTYTIDPEKVSRKLYVAGSDYYYLQNDQLFTNQKNFQHNAIHIMKGKVIASDGTVYDVSGKRLSQVTEPIKVLEAKTPLYTATIQDHQIETYLRYSLVDTVEKEGQFYVKGQMLSMIDASLENDKRAVLIDQYNGAEYETILGNDGMLYHLKASIAVSKNFNNKQIVEISDTATSDTPLLLIRYRDGSVLGFNYRTGEELVFDTVKKKVSLFDYARSFLGDQSNATIPSMASAYEQAEKLEKQLLEKPLVGEEQITDGRTSQPYMKVYQPLTKQFSIYRTDQVLKKEEVKSETDKIKATYDLAVLYQTETNSQKIRLPMNGVTIFISVIVCVFGILGYYYIHEVKKRHG